LEDALDSDLRDFCERQRISVAMDEHSDGAPESDFSSSEDDGCLDSFEEITKVSDFKLYSIFLNKA